MAILFGTYEATIRNFLNNPLGLIISNFWFVVEVDAVLLLGIVSLLIALPISRFWWQLLLFWLVDHRGLGRYRLQLFTLTL